MKKKRNQSLADMQAFIRVAKTSSPPDSVDATQHRRQIIADLCRLLAENVRGERNSAKPDASLPDLSPRMQQTLERLLFGDSEKQIANRLGLSKHTVHVYVKALYRGFEVSSRGELLAKFVQAPKFKARRRPTPAAIDDDVAP